MKKRVKNIRLAEEARKISLNEAQDQFREAQEEYEREVEEYEFQAGQAALERDVAIGVAEKNYREAKERFVQSQKRRKMQWRQERKTLDSSSAE